MKLLNLISGLLPIGEKLVDKLIPDPQAKQKALKELKKMDMDGSLKRMEAEFADKDSARQREMAISTSEHSPWLNKIITSDVYFVCCYIILGSHTCKQRHTNFLAR